MSLVALGNDSFDDFVSHNEIVVVDFFATWCGPCTQMLKILPGLAETVDGFARIGKVNVDQNPELKAQFEIKYIPTFLFFKNGKEEYRFSGVMRLQEIEAKLESLR